MKQPLPKKWARRIFAIRLGATLLAGAVLVALLALLALLYWMNAKAPMSDPAKMFVPGAPAWVIFRFVPVSHDRTVPADILLTARRGMPGPVANLVEQGLRDPSCPVALVLSRSPAGDRAMAVSLGKYPGRFRLVRRSLERSVEKRLLPYAIKYRHGMPMFFTDGAVSEFSDLMPLAIMGTTIIQAYDTAAMERLLDWIDNPAQVPLTYPEGTSCILDVKSWPLLTQLAGDFAPEWGEAVGRMEKELAVLGRLETISFEGNAPGGALYLSAATPEDAAEVAKELPEWIRKNPVIGSSTLAVGKVKTRENKVTISLTVTYAPTPVVPALP